MNIPVHFKLKKKNQFGHGFGGKVDRIKGFISQRTLPWPVYSNFIKIQSHNRKEVFGE